MVSCCSHRMVISVYDTGQLQVNHRNIVLAVYVFTHLWPFRINRRWSFWQNEECKFLVLLCYIFIVIMKRKWLKEVGYDYEPEGMIQQLTTTHFWVMIDFSILWRLKSSVAHFHVQLSNVCVYFLFFLIDHIYVVTFSRDVPELFNHHLGSESDDATFFFFESVARILSVINTGPSISWAL